MHLVILHVRTRKFRCLQYYEQSILFATFKDDDVYYLAILRCYITLLYYLAILRTRIFVCTNLLRTVHSVRYVNINYSLSICTYTTLSYYKQGRYSVVFAFYCFTSNIPFRLLLMNMLIHVPNCVAFVY